MSGLYTATPGQRYQMEALHKVGHCQTMIVNFFVVHKLTVSREL